MSDWALVFLAAVSAACSCALISLRAFRPRPRLDFDALCARQMEAERAMRRATIFADQP